MHRFTRPTLALLFGALFAAPFGTVAHATAAPVVVSAQVKNSPDDGCPAWARDTFTRTTTITPSGEGTNKVVIKDAGTFVTQVGAKTPGDASKTIGAAVTGTINGTGEFTVTGTLLDAPQLALLNGKTYDNGSYDCKQDVPAAKTTGQWPLQFFAQGATTTGIDPWTWTYKTACETRTESSTTEPVGNITGKVCPSASSSASATPSVSNPAPGASPAAEAASLPVTGNRPWLYAAAGGVALLVGGFFVAVSRKRRNHFQA